MNELPQMTRSTYGYTSGDTVWTTNMPWQRPYEGDRPQRNFDIAALIERQRANFDDITTDEEDEDMAEKEPGRRLVKVFIADPDENVPVDKCLLYSGDEMLTDLTDEELFFEIPIMELLEKHNAVRVKTKRENTKKTEYLKKARIRDLRMTVITIAEF